ncbi:hypothetical protein [Bauldia sp.]|uniref:hypothetical protein n=1 Tax=Bauldia sp. TaxID=2575872 RepID=UPI003BACC126
MRRVLVIAAAGVVAGCASLGGGGSGSDRGIWVRTDGQSGRDNPALAQQFEADKASCSDRGQVNQLCMAHRGYVLVPESQAAAKAAEFRAAAAARAGG